MACQCQRHTHKKRAYQNLPTRLTNKNNADADPDLPSVTSRTGWKESCSAGKHGLHSAASLRLGWGGGESLTIEIEAGRSHDCNAWLDTGGVDAIFLL